MNRNGYRRSKLSYLQEEMAHLSRTLAGKGLTTREREQARAQLKALRSQLKNRSKMGEGK